MTSTIGVPIKLLGEAQGHTVSIELTTGQTFRGKLLEAEDNMNVQLKDVTVTSREGRVSHLDQVYIRGSTIRFFIVPDMLRNAPMFRSRAQRGRGVGLARGRATVNRARGGGGGMRGRPEELPPNTQRVGAPVAGATGYQDSGSVRFAQPVPDWFPAVPGPRGWQDPTTVFVPRPPFPGFHSRQSTHAPNIAAGPAPQSSFSFSVPGLGRVGSSTGGGAPQPTTFGPEAPPSHRSNSRGRGRGSGARGN